MNRRKTLKRRISKSVPETESHAIPGPRRIWRKRIAILSLVGLLLIVTAWATGVIAVVPVFYARYHLTLRNNSDAFWWLTIAESLNADSAEVSVLKARIARRLNDLDEMEKHLRVALNAGGDVDRIGRERTLALAQSGNIDQVIDEIENWMLDPGDDVADLADAYSSGLEQKGRTNEAKVLLNVWLADCPSDPKPHVQLARIAEAELNQELAAEQYELAIEKNPDYPPALYFFGRFLISQKQPEQAVRFLNRCIEVDPLASPAAKILLAAGYRFLGQRDTAFNLLQNVIATPKPEFITSFARLSASPEPGEAEYEMGQLFFDESNYAKAEPFFRTAVELSPDHFDAERQLGITLQRLGKDEDAAIVMQRVEQKRKELADIMPYLSRIKANPTDYDARYEIGQILLNNGRDERAIHYFEGVLMDAPDHIPTHQLLLELYTRKSKLDSRFIPLAERHQQYLDRSNPRSPK